MTTDEKVARLERMIDMATAAVREDDEDAALLALMEALKTAETLPQKPDVICLPDCSGGKT